MQQDGGCGCAGGGRRRKTHKKHVSRRKTQKKQRGGGLVEDAVLAIGALGLYQYFVKPKRT
jgi:hypothetical protein